METETIKIVMEAKMKGETIEIDATVDARANPLIIMASLPTIKTKMDEIIQSLEKEAKERTKDALMEAIREKLDEMIPDDDDWDFEEVSFVPPEVMEKIKKLMGCDGNCDECSKNIARK